MEKRFKIRRSRLALLGSVTLTALLISLFVVAVPSMAHGGEQGTVCVQFYTSGATCTANDVRLEELKVVNLVNGCTQPPLDQMEAEFEALVSAAGSPDRYDIGFFIALDGGNALDAAGTCFHGYLDAIEQPLNPTPVYGDWYPAPAGDGIPDVYNMDPAFAGYWDGEPKDTADACGDMETNTQVLKRIEVTLVLPCDDLVDGAGNPGADGFVDVGVCASWDNNANTTCLDVTDAVPGTGSKCSCSRVNLPNQPTAIDLISFSATPQEDGVLLAWETATELNNLGFNVSRSDSRNGPRTQLNDRLIPAQMPGSTEGATYDFLDTTPAPGQRYYYWLEDIDTVGSVTLHGPAEVQTQAAEPPTVPGQQEPPPVVPEASTLLLLGSAATGLASYVGLQIRARRRK
jgi:hypothetical protein